MLSPFPLVIRNMQLKCTGFAFFFLNNHMQHELSCSDTCFFFFKQYVIDKNGFI